MATYPFIRDVTATTPDEECSACEKPAAATIRIATTYMRGEDDFYPACKRHRDIANGSLSRFLAHVRTKTKFIGDKR